MLRPVNACRRPLTSPSLVVDDLLERHAPTGTVWCGQHRRIGRVAERQEEVAALIGGQAEQARRERKVVDRRRHAADSELPCGKDHVLRRATHVPHDRAKLMLAARIRTYQGDRHRGAGQVAGILPDLGQLLQLLPIADDDERPALLVLGAAGAPAGVEDAVEVLRGNRLVRESAHDAHRVDRLPGVHRSSIGVTYFSHDTVHRTDQPPP